MMIIRDLIKKLLLCAALGFVGTPALEAGPNQSAWTFEEGTPGADLISQLVVASRMKSIRGELFAAFELAMLTIQEGRAEILAFQQNPTEAKRDELFRLKEQIEKVLAELLPVLSKAKGVVRQCYEKAQKLNALKSTLKSDVLAEIVEKAESGVAQQIEEVVNDKKNFAELLVVLCDVQEGLLVHLKNKPGFKIALKTELGQPRAQAALRYLPKKQQ